MKLLLDTHIAIWSLARTDLLTPTVKKLLEDRDNDIHVSAATIWEIGIKHALGRRSAPPIGADETIERCEEAGYSLIGVTPRDAAASSRLPLLHADPFDRLLVAQALEGPYRLVTSDTAVARYSDTVILMR